jgi:mono/diheme cytochrome c family protein
MRAKTILSAAALALAAPALATPPDAAAAARGRKSFNRYCISCHGVEGDGRGPSGDWVDPRPTSCARWTAACTAPACPAGTPSPSGSARTSSSS